MLSVESLYRMPVYEPRAAKRGASAKAAAAGASPKADRSLLRRIGRVHYPVFSPDGRRLVGLLVKRPDVAGMVKREDAFCAWDRVSAIDAGLLVSGEAALDAAAIERLGLDWDRCIIWSGMDVATRSGKALGRVADLTVGPEGDVERILVTDGDWAETFVGAVPVTMDLVVGVVKQRMIVADEVDDLELTGGMAAAAGEAFGKAKLKGSELATKAGAAAGSAIDKGSFALGKALGSAKRAVRDALADDGDDAGAGGATAPDGEGAKGAVAPTVAAATGASKDAPAATAAPTGTPAPPTKEPPQGTGDPVADVAQLIGRRIGETGSAFGEFLREFKENSR